MPTNKTDYTSELNHVDEERLVAASLPLGGWGRENAEARYNTYRRKGYTPAEALRYTVAWCRNMAEQKVRRVGHLTGAI